MSILPLLTPTGIPRAGLVAWHDLWFPNVLLQSNAFTTTPWTAATRSTVVQSATTYAPSGSLAWKLVEDNTAASTHYLTHHSPAGLQAVTYTFSVVFKAAERTVVRLSTYSPGAAIGCYFNLAIGAKGTASVGATGNIVPLGDGWYRCSVTGKLAAESTTLYMWIAEADNDSTFDGTGSAPYTEADPGIYIADAQLYPSATLPPYSATTTLQTAESGLIDLSGNGSHLSRGSNASGADTNDVTILGPGVSGLTDDYAKSAATGINKAGPFTLIWIGKPTGTSGTLLSLADSATANTKFQRILYSAAATLKAGSVAGGAESLSGELAVGATDYQMLALTSDGATLTLRRMDTGATVTVADTNPDGNACLGLGCTVGSSVANIADAFEALECIAYSRCDSLPELMRIYRLRKAIWASRGKTVL